MMSNRVIVLNLLKPFVPRALSTLMQKIIQLFSFVQRYALLLVALCAALAAASARKGVNVGLGVLALGFAGFGAFVAARQSWLQWYPPEVASCGRDLYGMIETFPLKRLVPMIFRGGGDCSTVDWTFLGGSIANWSFVCFVGFAMLLAVLLVRRLRS